MKRSVRTPRCSQKRATGLSPPGGMKTTLLICAKTALVGVIFSEVKASPQIWYRKPTTAPPSPFLSEYDRLHTLFLERAEMHFILQQAVVWMHLEQATVGG